MNPITDSKKSSLFKGLLLYYSVLFLLLSCFVGVVPAKQNTPTFYLWQTDHHHISLSPPLYAAEQNNVYDFAIGDFDFEGKEEVAILRKDHDYPLTFAIREIDSDSYTYPTQPAHISSFNGNFYFYRLENHKVYKWLTYRVSEHQGFVNLYNIKFQLVKSITTIRGQDKTGDGVWNGQLKSADITDINEDGRSDLFFTINTAGDGQPRALLDYDLYTGEKLLDLRLAPLIRQARVIECPKDRKPRILISLAGASDGAFFGPFSRDSSYLALLKPDGTPDKVWRFGGESSYVHFLKANLCGSIEDDLLVTFYSRLDQETEPSRVLLIDGATLKTVASIAFPEEAFLPRNVKISHFHHADKETILIWDDLNGKVKLYSFDRKNQEFQLLSSAKAEGRLDFMITDDFDGNGEPELLWYNLNTNEITITDYYLKPLFSILLDLPSDRVKKMAKLDISDYRERHYLLLSGHHLYRLDIPVAAVFPPPSVRLDLFDRNVELRLREFLLTLLLVMIPIIVAIVYFAHQRSIIRLASVFLSNRIGAAIIEKDLIKKYNEAFSRLIGPFDKDLKGENIHHLLSQSYLEELMSCYNMFVGSGRTDYTEEIVLHLPEEQRIVSVELLKWNAWRGKSRILMLLINLSETPQVERIKLWAAMARRVAHKTKTPLATVLLVIQRLQRAFRQHKLAAGNRYDAMTQSMIKEIARVRDSINMFMRFAKLEVPSLAVVSFTEYLKDTLDQYRHLVPANIEMKVDFAANNVQVRVDKKQLQDAIHLIFDNAILCMPAGGDLVIKLVPAESQRMNIITLQVMNNPDFGEEKAAPTSLDLSRQESHSDLGLILAKTIVENHGGHLAVKGLPNGGIRVNIQLPVYSKDAFQEKEKSE